MSSKRPQRVVASKKMNYARLNSKGKTPDYDVEVEDGEVVDSPLTVEAENDDFTDVTTEAGSIAATEITESTLELGDYEQDESDQEEMLTQREAAILEAREKREKLKQRLIREKRIAEAKLQEEEEKRELASLESEIMQLNNKRSVKNFDIETTTEKPKVRYKVKAKPKVNKRIVKRKIQPNIIVNIPQPRKSMTNITENKTTDAEKVKMWLDDSLDYPYIHETHSEPGDIKCDTQSNGCMPCISRRNMREQRRTEAPVQKAVAGGVQQQKVVKKKTQKQSDASSMSGLDMDGEYEDNYARNAGSSVYENYAVKQHRGELRSGFLDKPRTVVLYKLRWPHMNQNPRYVTKSLGFDDLNFAQLVGGECRTILKTDDADELYGRLRILSKVAYLLDQCKNWEKARSAYYAIMSSIEEGESSWSSTFGHYDMMCPPTYSSESKQSAGMTSKNRTMQKKDFFCREFQRGECNQSSPHRAWIRNNFEQVEHFCAVCYKARNGKQPHAPGTEMCSTSSSGYRK